MEHTEPADDRTAALEEIDAPVMFHCRPAPDYLPDPQSCLITGITPQLCLEKGLALSEELGNKLFMTICIGSIGSVWEKKGDYTKAMQNFERDLVLCQELGDKQGTAIACGLIGDLLSVIGEFDRAIEYLQQNLDLSRELNYKKGIAKALNTLGDTWFYKGDHKRSISYYNEAIEYAREMGNKLVLGYSLVEKGLLVRHGGGRSTWYSQP